MNSTRLSLEAVGWAGGRGPVNIGFFWSYLLFDIRAE